MLHCRPQPKLCEDVKQNLDVEVPVVPNENVDVNVNEDSEWKRWVERVVGSSATLVATNREGHKGHEIPNLSAYLAAKTALQIAEKKFESSLEECLGGLTKAMTEEMVSHSIGKVYEEQGERFETLERDFIKTVASNHERRNALLAKIEQANEDWQSCYKAIRASVMNQPNPVREAREVSYSILEEPRVLRTMKLTNSFLLGPSLLHCCLRLLVSSAKIATIILILFLPLVACKNKGTMPTQKREKPIQIGTKLLSPLKLPATLFARSWMHGRSCAKQMCC